MIHVLDFDDKIIDFLSNDDTALIRAEHKRNINDNSETLDLLILSSRAEHFRERHRIIIRDSNKQWREFIIDWVQDTLDGYTEVECTASYLTDITTAKPFTPGKFEKKTTTEALKEVLNDTGWQVSEQTEYDGLRTTSWTSYQTRYEVLKQLCTTYKMVLDFYIELGANTVKGRYVVLRKKNSLFKGKEIEYGKDLIGLTRKIDMSEIKTALIAIGPENEKGVRTEVVVTDDKAQEQFNLPTRYIWGIYEPQTDVQNMTEDRLRSLARTELNKRKSAVMSYEITSIDLEDAYPHEIITIGDTVRVKNRDFNPPLYVEAEVIAEEYNMISDDSKYTFGQSKEFKESELREEFNKRLDVIRQKLSDNISNINTIVAETLEGELQYFERKIIKSDTPPENPVNDMLWLDTSNPEVAVLRRYWNGKWIKASPEKAGDIGAISREQALYSELKNTFINLTIQHSRLLREVTEVIESEYLIDTDLKKAVNDKLNDTVQVFNRIKENLDSMTEETATIGKLVDTQALFLEYREKLQALYNAIENAKISIDDRFKLLQSQYTDEKFNEAMDKVAESIGGHWDSSKKQLSAEIPNKQDLEKMRDALIAQQKGTLLPIDKKIESMQKEIKNYENGIEIAIKKKLQEINDNGNLYRYSSPSVFKEASYYKADLITSGDDKAIAYNKKKSINFGTLNYHKWQENEKYTFSFTIKTDTDGVTINQLNDGYYNHKCNIKLKKDEWARKSITFTPTYSLADNGITLALDVASTGAWYTGWLGSSTEIGKVWIKDFQLEKGDVATSHKMNSSDQDDVFGNVNNKVIENSAKISAFEDKINLKADKTEVTQTLDKKLEPIKNDIKKQTSQIELLPDRLTETVSKKIYETTISGLVKRLETEEAKRETLANKINDTVSIQKYQSGIEEAKSYADDKLRDVANTPEIQESIKQANEQAQESLREYVRAQDELKLQEANAYIDNKISEEEQRAIDEARRKFEEAKSHAENKADEAKRIANQYAESRASDVQRQARAYTDGQILNSNRERDQILSQYDTKIAQNGHDINLRATKDEFNASKRTLSRVLADITVNAMKGIYLRYDENGAITSHTIDKDGVKISGDKVDITANREFNVVANNINNKVGKNEIVNSLNLSNEGLDINVNRIGIKGGNANRYVQVQNDFIELGGIVQRTWKGKRSTDDIFTRLKDGHLRFRNNTAGGSLYMSHFGISTYIDGEGEDGGSSGTIQWWDKTYSDSGMNGITINSYGGVVALTSDYNRIIIDSYASANIESREAPIYLSPNTKNKPGLNRFAFTLSNADSAYETDGYIMFGSDENYKYGAGLRFSKRSNKGLVQVVNGDYATGGDTTIESGMGKFNLVKRRDGNSYVSIQSYDLLAVGSDNAGDRVASNSIYKRTYSAPANLHITSAGTIGRATSAKKYKISIENQYINEDEQFSHSKEILKLPIRTWFDKYESEIMAKELESGKKLSDDTFKLSRHTGLIAEEVEELGFKEFVIYDDNGEIEGIAYDRLWVHLIPIIKNQQSKIEKLEELING
ncbi:TPA: hypothetical protein O2E11_001933 [Staphylococcus aureus]|uniref:phage tail spike protein n=1 Tax=Staphylococcus aureus TaxID=1280 RepID=UPI000B19D719|nr:phage tail spike protein [Staphylococcus aureus]TXN88390.1 hypothetical protein FVP24_09585 [Staphylococcus aureus]HCY9598606.1 hypothetical protein [Staphylococcus aureus]HDK4376824.1 hypothetical protein [Staphylococcus aureus]